MPGEFKLYGNADCGIRQQKVEETREAIMQVREGTYTHRAIHSRFLVKLPESEKREPSEEERIEDLTEKIRDKLAQTRSAQVDARRIVIVQVPEGRKAILEADDRALRICRKIQENIVPRHLGVSALFLCRRIWTVKMRYLYVGIIALGKEKDALSQSVLEKLNSMEHRTDWLSDWR